MSGPKRPHDRVSVCDMKADFQQCLDNKIGFKGFHISSEKQSKESSFNFNGENFTIKHGRNLKCVTTYIVIFTVNKNSTS